MSRRAVASIVACVASLGLAAAATAAPLLTITRAERTAERHVERVAEAYSGPDEVAVDDWTVEGCERDTRRRAVCDATYELSDGGTCFDEVVVTKAKKTGKVSATSSGAGGTFDECDEPEDEELDEGDELTEADEADLELVAELDDTVEPVE